MDLRYDSSRNLFSSGYLPHAVVGIHSGVSYYLAPFQGVMPLSPSLLLDPHLFTGPTVQQPVCMQVSYCHSQTRCVPQCDHACEQVSRSWADVSL